MYLPLKLATEQGRQTSLPKSDVTALAAELVLPMLESPDPLEVAWWPGTSTDVESPSLRLLWLGRFEHDKGGEGLLEILRHLERAGPPYELAVVGQQFRQSPPVFERIRRIGAKDPMILHIHEWRAAVDGRNTEP